MVGCQRDSHSLDSIKALANQNPLLTGFLLYIILEFQFFEHESVQLFDLICSVFCSLF